MQKKVGFRPLYCQDLSISPRPKASEASFRQAQVLTDARPSSERRENILTMDSSDTRRLVIS